ncbi:tubulin-like doman-containing protein, partial [Microcystis aeruginosa]|uniref:tubulin-like doman-containing protein n=1 Tax=Microcystis aeruginosa TaxID=1126 RepID=UPI001CA3B0E6
MSSVAQTDRKDIVPTLVIGVGGTGLEVILRVRRLITESYGSLKNFPIVGFLHIDTDSGYKPSNPLMIGPPLEEGEKYYSKVTLLEVQPIVKNPSAWDCYHEWLPPELISNPQLLASQEGAGQIRACGRFSFFFNRDKIEAACQRLKKEIRKGQHISFMQEKYQLKVKSELNVFVACSIAGGTGSGMLIDLGYSLQNWLFSGEKGDLTAIICTPDAFGNVSANDRVQCNGYAALMELNYFSDQADDPKTKFSVRYKQEEGSRVENDQAPYGYTYLIGSTNGSGVNLSLDQVREVMAQNIFLDLVSDFSPYKRSIRDNIKRKASSGNDKPPIGRSYPRNFMSFGLASIEVPIHHIRSYLASRLATDLYQWWQNSEVELPAQPETMVTSQLREINLLRDELRKAILRAKDQSFPYQAVVQTWLSEMRQDIITNNRLQCTATGLGGMFSKEKGKIIEFIDQYLRPQVDDYKRHFDDSSPDKRTHGDYLRVMYDNQAMVIKRAETELREQLYANLLERNLGPKFVRLKLEEIKRSFDADIERLSKEAEKSWLVIEGEARKQYEAGLSRMNEMIPRPGLEKQSLINKEWDDISKYLVQNFNAFLERKSRILAVEVLRRMKEYINQLERQFNKWQTRIEQSKIESHAQAQQFMNQADALEIVGIKLFKRQELNEWYEDFLANVVNTNEINLKVAARNGLNVLCERLTEIVLVNSSSLWVEDRPANASFRLFDIEKIKDIQYPDFAQIVYQQTQTTIKNAGNNTKLVQNMDACTGFMQEYPNEFEQKAKIQELFEQSKPLVRLDRNIPQNSGFDYINFAKAGLLGGDNPQEPGARKQADILRIYFNEEQAIAPLTEKERHKILAIHEVGGFSLRCIQGMDKMRESYQLWRGQRIEAERKRLRGQRA